MNKSCFRIIYFAFLFLLSSVVFADPFVGNFTLQVDGKYYAVTISRTSNSGYDAVMHLAEESLAIDARRFGDRIAGQVTGANGSFGFVAHLQGGAPVLQTEDGRTLVLRRAR